MSMNGDKIVVKLLGIILCSFWNWTISPSFMAGSCQEPPDVCGAWGGGDPQRADQRTGGEEQPARKGELPAQEPGQPGTDGEVPVPHPDRRAVAPGQSERLGAAADLQPQHWICCISGSALGRAEPQSLSSNGPRFERMRHEISATENPFDNEGEASVLKTIDGTHMNCCHSKKTRTRDTLDWCLIWPIMWFRPALCRSLSL